MSYSKLATYIPVATSNYGSRNGCAIDTITVHHMAGNLTLQQCHDCWTGKSVSANYGVDSNGNIACFVDEEYRSYASANGDNDRRAITIEVANDICSEAGQWHCSDAAVSGLVKLLIDVCQRNNIPKLLWQDDKSLIGQIDKQNMTIHQWFYATVCPGPYLHSIMGDIANRVNEGLCGSTSNSDLTSEEFATMFTEMRKDLQQKDGSSWSAPAREWATTNKVFSGNTNGEYMWKDFCSREQVATLFYKLSSMFCTTVTEEKSDEEKIWDFLFEKLGNKYAAAGVMGNIYAESGLKSNNLQNSYNTKLKLTDEEYTSKVDNGTYKNFVKDSAGYGLCQWTYWSRKQGLQEYAQVQGKSIADLQMQLEYLYKELTSYKLIEKLKASKTVKEASNIILLQFEKPLDQGSSVQSKRAEFGKVYLERYGK